MDVADFQLKVEAHPSALQRMFFHTAIEGLQKRLFAFAEV
jgi:hypothetical protein